MTQPFIGLQRRDHPGYHIDPELVTLWQLFRDVDINGPMDALCYGKYKVSISRLDYWKQSPIYNMGYLDVS